MEAGANKDKEEGEGIVAPRAPKLKIITEQDDDNQEGEKVHVPTTGSSTKKPKTILKKTTTTTKKTTAASKPMSLTTTSTPTTTTGGKRRPTSDRLSEDKAREKSFHSVNLVQCNALKFQEYLTKLMSGIGETMGGRQRVDKKVSKTASEALNFLQARDEFWKQVNLGAKAKPVTFSNRLSFKQSR